MPDPTDARARDEQDRDLLTMNAHELYAEFWAAFGSREETKIEQDYADFRDRIVAQARATPSVPMTREQAELIAERVYTTHSLTPLPAYKDWSPREYERAIALVLAGAAARGAESPSLTEPLFSEPEFKVDGTLRAKLTPAPAEGPTLSGVRTDVSCLYCAFDEAGRLVRSCPTHIGAAEVVELRATVKRMLAQGRETEKYVEEQGKRIATLEAEVAALTSDRLTLQREAASNGFSAGWDAGLQRALDFGLIQMSASLIPGKPGAMTEFVIAGHGPKPSRDRYLDAHHPLPEPTPKVVRRLTTGLVVTAIRDPEMASGWRVTAQHEEEAKAAARQVSPTRLDLYARVNFGWAMTPVDARSLADMQDEMSASLARPSERAE